MEIILKEVADFAARAHGDQKRKYTPDPYIVHPIRVMEICQRYTGDICILAAALLHDVLEDTPVKKDEIKAMLLTLMRPEMAERTVKLVVELTDVYVKKDYPGLNRRARKGKELERLVKTNADSQTIKYADIIDNAREIVMHDPDFGKVYLFECRTVLHKLDKGNSALHKEANKVVAEGIMLLNKR